MSRPTPQIRKLANYLMLYETLRHKASKAETAAPVYLTDKLRPHLTTLMGNGGFQALLSRALALASADVSWLRALHVKADGTLEGLAKPHAGLDPAELLEGRVVLLAQLLGLLVALIGPNLTSRLLGEVWPEISLDDLDFGTGGQDAKTK
jgi:hypothetical protein